MNEDFLDSYERLLNKANSYATGNLADCFDKFSTLFTLYNLQYNYVAKSKNIKKDDNYKAIGLIKKFIDCKSFCEKSIIDNKSAEIIRLIEDGAFYLKNVPIDSEVVKKMKSTDFEERTKGILEALYYVRCNLVHGDKTFTDDQRRILNPCIVILNELNSIVFERIRFLIKTGNS